MRIQHFFRLARWNILFDLNYQRENMTNDQIIFTLYAIISKKVDLCITSIQSSFWADIIQHNWCITPPLPKKNNCFDILTHCEYPIFLIYKYYWLKSFSNVDACFLQHLITLQHFRLHWPNSRHQQIQPQGINVPDFV